MSTVKSTICRKGKAKLNVTKAIKVDRMACQVKL